ncbi:ATP-grasp domain-containing protein [bacterium]|nr:ATP-grasp domain-containing protein [bacterium]
MPQNILVIFDAPENYPAGYTFEKELQHDPDWSAERDVIQSLKRNGHTVSLLGICDDFDEMVSRIKSANPDCIFNLAEQFLFESTFDRHLVGLFEMLQIPYTGPGPSALFLCKNKGVAKKVLGYEGILTPQFQIFPRKDKITLSKKMNFPLFVKPLREEASYGITENSLVHNAAQLKKRVAFIHQNMARDAMAEEFIEGRELYVSILGNKKPDVLPIREMVFEKSLHPEREFASFKAKWNKEYRLQKGIRNDFAAKMPKALEKKIKETATAIYRLLYLSGYARLDFRLDKRNRLYFIEANPNPHIGSDEDFSQAAAKAGYSYDELVSTIVELGIEEHKSFFER